MKIHVTKIFNTFHLKYCLAWPFNDHISRLTIHVSSFKFNQIYLMDEGNLDLLQYM